MRSLGINLEETAVISSVIPVVAIFIPPIAGLIGDKIGNYKVLFDDILKRIIIVVAKCQIEIEYGN